VIAISAGHGGSDHGAKSDDGSLCESLLTLPIAARVAALVGDGRAVLTRAEDVSLRDEEEHGIAVRAGADAAVALHFDSYPADPSRCGPVAYVRRGDTEGLALAHEILRDLSDEHLPTVWLLPDPRFPRATALLRDWTPMPCALIEIDFLSNPAAVARLSRPGALDDIAAKVAKGINRYLEAICCP